MPDLEFEMSEKEVIGLCGEGAKLILAEDQVERFYIFTTSNDFGVWRQ